MAELPADWSMFIRLSGCNLLEKLTTSDTLVTEETCISYMRQICQAVSEMHKNNIVHLNLRVITYYLVDKKAQLAKKELSSNM